MSGLVINEQAIDPTTIKTKKVKIERYNCSSLGTRIWFQILSTDKEMFQRWSMGMNPTDEVLFVTQVGDTLELEYSEDRVEDPITNSFDPFNRNVILQAKFV